MKLLSSAAIRRCLIADPGYYIVSADFDQIELRVIAALAGEESMIEAAKRGESLHKLCARRLFGENYTPDQYKLAKNINFTWAFGGGAGKMAKTYGIPMPEAVALVRDYENEFRALVRFKREQQQRVLDTALSAGEQRMYRIILKKMFDYRADTREGQAARRIAQLELKRLCYGKLGKVVTPFGRTLLVDAVKPYTVVNYLVQSSAADIMKDALIRVMGDPELEPGILLPVHDELIAQAWIPEAESYAKRLAEVMTTSFQGVPITASGEVYGKSWGHGYL